ncbi:MAG: HD-GYP domain-containing protein [Planctomycetota bacterium]|nr:MAG: HD-GYP domain-containing protein [Planctomycetota bacterium]REJ92314.1 MAG: HD-GYP domain-containing protein [Planctomycetota bacterium]
MRYARAHGNSTRLHEVAMLRVPVNMIEPGMVLARPIPVPSDPRRFLLQRDHEIPLDLVPRLRDLGIVEVWVRHRDLEFLEDLIDEGLSDCQREVYASVRSNFESIMQETTAQLDVGRFQSSIGGLFDYLKKTVHGNVLLHKLDAFDNYLMSHSANVGYLSLLLGMQLERYLIDERSAKSPRDAKDLTVLGVGCLLHDVGKMRIPSEVLNKPERLTDEEMAIVKQHPVYGYEMVKGRVPASAAQIVLNHHQRFNGEGYPPRVDPDTGELLPPLAGKQIPVFSRIATVVDIYDAATTARCYSGAKQPVQVLHEMRTWCEGFFDPVVADAFYRLVPPFPIGQVVGLSDGSEAAVVDFNPNRPTRPKLQGLKDPKGQRLEDPSLHEIDLALHLDLQITTVNGTDIRPYLASLETPILPETSYALL